ncbi:hypothetical protein V2J09_018586 [Rumex salicifolius]
MAESTDNDEEIGPFSAFSVGGEGSGFARLARGGAGVGFGQTTTADSGTSGMVMTGVGVGNTAGLDNAGGQDRGRAIRGRDRRRVSIGDQFIRNPNFIQIRQELHCHTRRLDIADLHPHIVDGPGTWWSIAQRSGITESGSLEYGHVDHILIAAFMEHWYPRVPRPFVVDMITTWLEDEKITEVERQHLCRILEILIEDPHLMPPPPRIFRNSQYEAGEGSAVRANRGDEQHKDRVDAAHEQHQAEEGSGAATVNQADEQHEDRVDAAHD